MAETVLYYSQHHQDALILEISLLRSTLRRNRASHRRTLYWRRAQMAVRSLERHGLLELFEAWQSLLERDLLPVMAWMQRNQRKRGRDVAAGDFWQVQKSAAPENGGPPKGLSQDDTTRTTLFSNDSAAPDPQQHQTTDVIVAHWEERCAQLCRRTTAGIRDCLERIDHYAKAAVAELVRGFFLPLLTVLSASLARIRLLLQRLQSHVLTHWILRDRGRTSLPSSQSAFSLAKGDDDDEGACWWKCFSTATRQRLMETVETLTQASLATEPDAAAWQNYAEDTLARSERTAATLQSLGLVVLPHNGIGMGGTKDQDTTTNNNNNPTTSERASPDVPATAAKETTRTTTPTTSHDGGPGGGDDASEARTAPPSTTAAAPTCQQSVDMDVGVGVRAAVLWSVAAPDESCWPMHNTTVKGGRGAPPPQQQQQLDSNAMLLEQLRRGKKKRDPLDQSKKGSKKKQRRERSSDTQSSPKPKKKKTKGGDFFDELFG